MSLAGDVVAGKLLVRLFVVASMAYRRWYWDLAKQASGPRLADVYSIPYYRFIKRLMQHMYACISYRAQLYKDKKCAGIIVANTINKEQAFLKREKNPENGEQLTHSLR